MYDNSRVCFECYYQSREISSFAVFSLKAKMGEIDSYCSRSAPLPLSSLAHFLVGRLIDTWGLNSYLISYNKKRNFHFRQFGASVDLDVLLKTNHELDFILSGRSALLWQPGVWEERAESALERFQPDFPN